MGTPSSPAPAGGRLWSGTVICVGGAVLDLKLHLLAPAVPGTSNPARRSTGAGGVARNVAENLARLGVRVSLVCRLGDDEAGRDLLAGLDRLGVDRAGARVVEGAGTAQYVALLQPDGGLVIAAAAMDVLDGFGSDDLGAVGLHPADLVFAEANLPAPVLTALIERCHRSGARLLVDAVSTAKATRLPADLAGVGVLLCNLDEARAWQASHRGPADRPARQPERSSAEELVVGLVEAGAAAAVLTLGAAGALVGERRAAAGQVDVVAVPAVPAVVVDVTGAGDALVAGTVAGLVSGDVLTRAVGRGVALAALTVAVPQSVHPGVDAARLFPDSQGAHP